MSDLIARCQAQLKVEEGTRLKLYNDTKGNITIGTGRNIGAVGISQDESDLMLSNDIKNNILFLEQYAWYTKLDEVRQAALVDLCFMGAERLLHFVHMIAALGAGDFPHAEAEVLNSQWFKDVGPGRGNRVAKMILSGAWPADIPYTAPTSPSGFTKGTPA